MSKSDLLKNSIEREVARGWTVEFQSETSARLSDGTQQLTLNFDGEAVRYVRTSTVEPPDPYVRTSTTAPSTTAQDYLDSRGANVPPPEQRPPPSPRKQRPPPIAPLKRATPVQVIPPARYIFKEKREQLLKQDNKEDIDNTP